LHFALTWADIESELYRDLNTNLDFGIIGNSFERARVEIRVTFNNFTPQERKTFHENPAYISAFDMV
jgi:hypothetical protein